VSEALLMVAGTGLAFLLALAHTIRYVSKKHDERDWVRMKSNTEHERKNQWIRN